MAKFKKAMYLFIVILFSVSGLIFSVHAKENKINVDCIFSVGERCRTAHWLRENELRFQSAPLDWMWGYSLNTVLHLFKTGFKDFFEEIEDTGSFFDDCRIIKDTKNNIVSEHHFKKNIPLKKAHQEVRKTMLTRAKKVDEILKKSDSIGLICNRQKETLEDFKNFIKGFSEIYPDKKITLINIHDISGDKDLVKKQGDKVTCKTLYEEGDFKIIEYSFKDVTPDAKKYKAWRGNPFGWKEVLGDIRLSKKASGNNVDYKKVEF